MEIKKQFVVREIAGEFLLVPAGKTALDLNGMITMNDVAAEIWNMLPEMQNEDEIVQRILLDYEASEAQVRADVSDFLNKLRELGIV